MFNRPEQTDRLHCIIRNQQLIQLLLTNFLSVKDNLRSNLATIIQHVRDCLDALTYSFRISRD